MDKMKIKERPLGLKLATAFSGALAILVSFIIIIATFFGDTPMYFDVFVILVLLVASLAVLSIYLWKGSQLARAFLSLICVLIVIFSLAWLSADFSSFLLNLSRFEVLLFVALVA
jgi:hypothetical protein